MIKCPIRHNSFHGRRSGCRESLVVTLLSRNVLAEALIELTAPVLTAMISLPVIALTEPWILR